MIHLLQISKNSSSSFAWGFMFSRLAALGLLFCIFIYPAFAAMDAITTFELGGASNSPGIADKNHLIIEEDFMSYRTKFKGDKSYSYQLGQTKLRYGLIDNKLEARVTSAGVTLNEIDSGLSNMSLGTKIRLRDESKYIPSAEIITDWEIPVGDRDLRNVGFDQSYMLIMGKMFTKKFGSIINATVDFSSFNANTGTSAIVSAPLVFNLNYYVKPELNLFSHIYGTVYFTEGIDNPLAMDIGASYAITKDLVVVSWVSKGLNEAAPDMTIDLGFIYRI
jgi:hypothetical protein